MEVKTNPKSHEDTSLELVENAKYLVHNTIYYH